MSGTSPEGLEACLRMADLDPNQIARSGGGVWLFGSRAADCARLASDWDLLVVSTSARATRRTKRCGIDLSIVPLNELAAWSRGELAAHVSAFGLRVDDGATISIPSQPTLAAPRKQAAVAARAEQLLRLRAALQPEQLRLELLRLRRNAHRGWLLTRNTPVPATAILDQEWSDMRMHRRALVLDACNVTAGIRTAILEQPVRSHVLSQPTKFRVATFPSA